MASRHYRAQLTVPHDSGLPADAIVNTWHFMGDDGLSDANNALDFLAQLDAFYTSWVPTMGSTALDWANCNVKFTVFEDPTPRIPFYEAPISPGTPPSSNYDWPAEVAVVLSMEAARISGANMRRRRGRVFLGPFSFGVGDVPTLPTGNADTIAAGADAAFFGAGNTTLAVYSPYTHHDVPVGENIKDHPDEDASKLILAFHEVEKVWVDNAFDTQRRRGLTPTYRKTYTK